MSDPTPSSELSQRDLATIRAVARFKQLTAAQIRTLLFHQHNTNTPSDRTLRRLVERSYLIRIERRLVGGSRGGSGQYVYALGRRGYFMFYEGRYSPSRAVSHHALAVAEAYLALLMLERAGEIRVAGVSTEPDCWVVVGGNELKPDLRVDLFTVDGRKALYWLEIDMGTENQKQLRGKLTAYVQAYEETTWAVFPKVLWIAVDVEREKELRWLIGQMSEQAQPLFEVATLSGLPALLR